MHNTFSRFTLKQVQKTQVILSRPPHVRLLRQIHSVNPSFPKLISITWFNRTGFCSNATGPDCVLDLVRPSVLIITSAPESLFFTQTHCGWLSVATAPAFGRLWLHPLAPGNAVPRSEIITLAQHRVSRDGWDVCVILTFQLIAEHLFSHVGESAAEIMYPIL